MSFFVVDVHQFLGIFHFCRVSNDQVSRWWAHVISNSSPGSNPSFGNACSLSAPYAFAVCCVYIIVSKEQNEDMHENVSHLG